MSRRRENNEDGHTAPDSTTKEKPAFSYGDEVLMQRKDGNFYLGTVVQIDVNREQCLVKFDDNTDSWSVFSRLTKLSAGPEVACVKCKTSNAKQDNEIIVCNRCSRGYHQLCHVPQVKGDEFKDGRKWECCKCHELPGKRQLPLRKSTAPPPLPAAVVGVGVVTAPPAPPPPPAPSLPPKKSSPPPPPTPTLRSQPSPTPSSSSSASSSSLSTTASFTLTPTPSLPLATDAQKKKLPYDINELQWDMQHRVNSDGKYCYCGGSGKWFLQMTQCGRCRQWFHLRCIASSKYPLFYGDRFYIFICSICNSGEEYMRRLSLKWVDLVHLAIFNLTLKTAKKYMDVDANILDFINTNWDFLQLPAKIACTNISDRREIIMAVLTSNRNRFKCGREVKKRTTIWGLRVRVPPPPPIFSLPPNKPMMDQNLLDAWNNNPRLKFLLPSCLESEAVKLEEVGFLECDHDALLGLSLLHIESRPLILAKGVPANGHNTSKVDLPPTPPSSESNPEAGVAAQPDTSGDESSSRGTLDSIIPPPVDFEGRNNPFMTSSQQPFPLGAVAAAPIQRPIKRRLSEKDLRISSNGEVCIKRRRFRRPGGNKFNCRTLMRRSKSLPTTPTSSPVKSATAHPLNLEELKSSVNHFFGARNRITSGEQFTVRGKRVTPDGRSQFLIEWGHHP